MRYTCSNCGEEFNTKETKVRCPSCLRKNGLIPAEENSPRKGGLKKSDANGVSSEADKPEKSRKLYFAIGCVALVIAAAIAGIYWWSRSTDKPVHDPLEDPGLGKQPVERLKTALAAVGFPKEPIPFEITGPVEKWSSPLKGKSPENAGAALSSMIQKLMESRGMEFADTPDIGNARILTASQLLDLPERTGSKGKPEAQEDERSEEAESSDDGVMVSSYSLAALGLAGARAAGHKAVMVEIHQASHIDGPPDPTGARGRFGTAFMDDDFEKPVVVLDPVTGTIGGMEVVELLTDMEALGLFLNLRAQRNLEAGSEPGTTQLLSEGARNLAPRSATVRCGGGLLLAALGGIQPAEGMVQSAMGLRDDAPRHFCMAQIYLMTQRLQEALAMLEKAIRMSPKYAHAYLEIARIMLASGNLLEVEEHLDRAESARPGLWEAKVLRAMVPAVRGDASTTIRRLQSLHSQRPRDVSTFFSLWQILKKTGQDERAGELEKAMLKRLDRERGAQVRERLRQTKEFLSKLKERMAEGEDYFDEPADYFPAADDTPTPTPAPAPGTAPPPPADLDFKLETPIPPGKTPGGPGEKFKLDF